MLLFLLYLFLDILPWLFNLAEMNNSLPSLEIRVELANHLFTVLSTAAYCILFVLLSIRQLLTMY